MMNTYNLQSILDNRYNPEDDLGKVTYTDATLLQAVIDLADLVAGLQEKLHQLEKREQKNHKLRTAPVSRGWLIDYLATNGVSKPADIVASAEKESISKSMIYRTRRQIGPLIRDTHGRQDPANCWELVDF